MTVWLEDFNSKARELRKAESELTRLRADNAVLRAECGAWRTLQAHKTWGGIDCIPESTAELVQKSNSVDAARAAVDLRGAMKA